MSQYSFYTTRFSAIGLALVLGVSLPSQTVFACINDDPTPVVDAKTGVVMRNDDAVKLIMAGKYDQAIAMLLLIEKNQPNLASTASNLGTALELSGHNADALTWIKTGIKRNPQDHAATEWLHVKILEAKINLEKDPQWLENHFVLGVDFVKDPADHTIQPLPIDFLGNSKTLADTEKAIDYQLAERLKFVTPPDKIVGDLYLSWADVARLDKKIDTLTAQRVLSIRALYDEALRFGTDKNIVLIQRRASYDKQHKSTESFFKVLKREWGASSNNPFVKYGVPIFVCVFSVLMFRRARQNSQ